MEGYGENVVLIAIGRGPPDFPFPIFARPRSDASLSPREHLSPAASFLRSESRWRALQDSNLQPPA